MSKGIISKANQQQSSLNGVKKEWDYLLWAGGGILSHFPFLFTIPGIFMLKNDNYKKLLKDYLTGGELLWISAVFLITTMGYLLTDVLNPSKRSNVSKTKRRAWLLCGGAMFLICFAVYVVRKGQVEPLPVVSSLVLWLLSVSISVRLIKLKEI